MREKGSELAIKLCLGGWFGSLFLFRVKVRLFDGSVVFRFCANVLFRLNKVTERHLFRQIVC